jgi:hypothetical protein
VAARESFVGLVVVFDVIGAKVLAGIVDVDVVVGDEEVALSTLRAFGGELGDAAFDCGRVDLLRVCGRTGQEQGNSKQYRQQRKLKRGKFASMRVAIHAEGVANRISSIA